jgi:hypothetical protein
MINFPLLLSAALNPPSSLSVDGLMMSYLIIFFPLFLFAVSSLLSFLSVVELMMLQKITLSPFNQLRKGESVTFIRGPHE